MRRNASRRLGVPILVCALSACLLGARPAVAAPSNSQIAVKQAQAAAASSKLQDLSDELEGKVEDYNAANEALDKTRDDIVATEAKLAQLEKSLADSEALLGVRADAIYRGGGSVGLVQVLLGTTDFEDFLTRVDVMNRISSQDADLVSTITGNRDQVAEARSGLESREAEQVALRQDADAKKRAVEASVARQAAYVASLNSEVKRLIKDEEARQARIAAELAREASKRIGSGGRSPQARTGDVSKLGAPHPDALAVAKKFVGVPYVWGGTSPSGFDCSGLCQYAYARIGISLPRTSRSMYRVGAFIPADRTDLLEPGDLVFFGYGGDPNRVHHVGMYAGNGVFLHAPGTGDHVKYSSLTDRIRSRGDYVGAVRP